MKIAILLGNRMNDDGTLSDLALIRLKTLIQADGYFKFDKIILSGGLANKKAGITEANSMKAYLDEIEGFSNRLILEDKSLTTEENAKYSAEIIKELTPCEVVVITSLEHMGRSFLNPINLFQKAFADIKDVKLSVYSSQI